MSPSPQVTPSIVLLLTNRRPAPLIGVGQKSPLPPGRFEAMYSLRPSRDWIGHPSVNGVFRSGWFAAISSIFCAAPHAEPCDPPLRRAHRPKRRRSQAQTRVRAYECSLLLLSDDSVAVHGEKVTSGRLKKACKH